MPIPRLAMKTLTAAAAVALLATATAPAYVARSRPFDIYTSKTKTKGQAHTYGTARFLKNGNVRIAGRINDVCPQDGYGAYVYFRGSGGLGAYGSAKDLRGCEEAAVSFAFTRTPESYEGSIDEVVISLREYDQINPPSGIYKRGDVNSFTVTRR